jgi:catecholate siderophore receptor
VFGSYTWIPSANIDNAPAGSLEAQDTRPGLTPRHSGSIWSTYRLTQKWRVGGGLNARSSDKPVGTAAPIVAPKFMTADLMAEYVEGPLAFKLNLFNVTDEIYADQLYRGHYIPGKPRTLQLTTAYKF